MHLLTVATAGAALLSTAAAQPLLAAYEYNQEVNYNNDVATGDGDNSGSGSSNPPPAKKPDLSVCSVQNVPPQTRMLVVAMTPAAKKAPSSLSIQILDDQCKPINSPTTATSPPDTYNVEISSDWVQNQMGINLLKVPSSDKLDDWEVDATYGAKSNHWTPANTNGCILKSGAKDLAAVTLGCTFFNDTGFPVTS